MNATPAQPVTIGWDLMLEAGVVAFSEADESERLLSMGAIEDHGRRILGIAAGGKQDRHERFLFPQPPAHGGSARWVTLFLYWEGKAPELRLQVTVQQGKENESAWSKAEKDVAVPLTWCPRRKVWLGQILRRGGDVVRDPQDPSGPLLRRSTEEEVAAAIAEAWRWAIDQVNA